MQTKEECLEQRQTGGGTGGRTLTGGMRREVGKRDSRADGNWKK